MTIFLFGQALPILQQTSGHVTGQSNKVAQSGLSESHGKYGPEREKTCLLGFANNMGADQPAHLRSLINAFIIRFLESIICKLATGEISTF